MSKSNIYLATRWGILESIGEDIHNNLIKVLTVNPYW